jgi:hypothetical protein
LCTRKKKDIPLIGPKRTPSNSWRLEEKARIDVAQSTHETPGQEKRKDRRNLKYSPNIKSRGKEPGWNKRIDATQ